VPELSQDYIFYITEHLKRSGAWENEEIKVHEVLHKKVGPYKAGWFLGGDALGSARNPRRRRR
jgi:hypothetical protein